MPLSDKQEKQLQPWKVIQSKMLLEVSPWFLVRQEQSSLPDGQVVQDFYSIDQPDYVVIFGTNSANEAICLWHYKHGPGRICLGLPAGYIQDGELPLSAAKRELFEETGCKAKAWHHLGCFTVDGNRGCGKANIFRAEGVYRVNEPMPDDLEEFKIEWLDFASLKKHLFSGEVGNISDALGMRLGMEVDLLSS